ncbi:DUF1311 domain-containing protein [Xenorhabdus sp. 42]|uniref:DUF1311 domain-containing protein n=1 Tax=Xenorhabdus szentirmaii TaxID=290112 RepID=A0AAW3YM27_9GAMM|nr:MULTISPECIES: lysozyme inhibitor LprI family protein [Xenorhabdus]MBD2781053.1 DUF1311 domain-containing protein [Xenorhabdus sp. 38]MBD2799075.1 DUF1311 domain-containing protein [Xenorhabdus sp. M]MBD2805879.1 DUF1311 domain-containing protein [Xenorhabdus sp. ZM]MBD2822083.1 DUF1311 domain-containing protein [Xenorhabdus sp. 42]MBD2825918.1 DUF1311 domain-containing protein [Xenorhabdus sp. 5]
MRILVIILLIFSTRVFSYEIDDRLDKCLGNDYTTLGMAACYAKAAGEWDNELNKEYQLILSSLDDNGKKPFKASQLAWVKYRDNYFEFLKNGYPGSGTMWRVFSAEERMNVVKQKVVSLQNLRESLSPK